MKWSPEAGAKWPCVILLTTVIVDRVRVQEESDCSAPQLENSFFLFFSGNPTHTPNNEDTCVYLYVPDRFFFFPFLFLLNIHLAQCNSQTVTMHHWSFVRYILVGEHILVGSYSSRSRKTFLFTGSISSDMCVCMTSPDPSLILPRLTQAPYIKCCVLSQTKRKRTSTKTTRVGVPHYFNELRNQAWAKFAPFSNSTRYLLTIWGSISRYFGNPADISPSKLDSKDEIHAPKKKDLMPWACWGMFTKICPLAPKLDLSCNKL